jgi:hypothetical protein
MNQNSDVEILGVLVFVRQRSVIIKVHNVIRYRWDLGLFKKLLKTVMGRESIINEGKFARASTASSVLVFLCRVP